MTDISFKVPGNYSNIDILAYDPNKDKYYDIEVKYRSAFKISKNDSENALNGILKQLLRVERQAKINEIIGNKAITKVFVTTKLSLGKTNTIKDELINKLKQKGYDSEVWYFDDIITTLYKMTEVKGRYNSELKQTIRLIKTYMLNHKITGKST
jgi:Holliday junction resolvase